MAIWVTRLVSSVMIGLIALSSAGLPFNFHHCSGKVKSRAVFSSAKDCFALIGMDDRSCNHSKLEVPNGVVVLHKKTCCHNSTTYNVQKIDWNQDAPVSDFIQSVITVSIEESPLCQKVFSSFKFFNERPPPWSNPIWLILGVFRL